MVEVAGEMFDGMHQALGYSRENYGYVMDNVKLDAERGGGTGGSSTWPPEWCGCASSSSSQTG